MNRVIHVFIPVPARHSGTFGRRLHALTVLLAILTSSLGSAGVPTTPTAKAPQRVLVIYSDERLLPANIAIDDAIHATFAAATGHRVELYSEFLDRTRFPGEAQEQRQRDFLRGKYRERPPHLVIAVSGAALAFTSKYRAEVFAGAPIVYCSAPGDSPPPELRATMVPQVSVPNAAAPTLHLALRLHSDARLVAVIYGSSPRDVQLAEGLRSEIPALENRVAFLWLTNRSLPELRADLSRLPDHSIVLYHTMFQDADGRTFLPRQALAEFAPASRSPIYGYYDTYLGHGIVGGSMVTFEAIGRKTALLGIRILNGEDPQTAARAESHQSVPLFDWRELRRWNISEKSLPPGCVVRFRPPSLWESHKDYVVGGVVIFLAQSATIAALLLQRSRRRLAEATTREDEKRMALAADSAKLGMWVWDIGPNKLWVSERGKQLFGYPPDAALTLEMFRARVHPEDGPLRDEAIQHALAGAGGYVSEYRVQWPDGTVRWLASRGRVEFSDAGKPVLARGVILDITESKQTEQALAQHRNELAHLSRVTTLSELSGSLAHELNQPLAIILTNAQAAQRLLAQSPPDLAEARDILADIVSEDQRAGEVIRRLRSLLKPGETSLQPISVNEILEDVLRIARSDLIGRGVTVHRAFSGSLPPALGDRVQLQQVLLNLILNACDAMNGIPSARQVLTLTTAHRDGVVRVSVADNGCGLPEDVDRVFEPFYTTKKHGLGLGLSICRSIVTAHKGRLWAENGAPGGAVFHLELPAGAEGKL